MPEDVCLAKNSPLIFLHNSESFATLNRSKKKKKRKEKIDLTLILSIIAKEKSDQIPKSEKHFWFFTTLIVFVIAYVISMMRTGFLMANTCVHNNMFA